ncbi:cellulose synthase subunit BcsC-related outer membrane protein [Paraburkholderia sp. CNPSo 3272]|uniref:cellulose synthase subunit BcsC-related outer membrane protein n=1 Tax=Paraburkholderia sp. CNPSo 3272 TaxID=2940931 RepID=UPI0020B7ED65|nr:cellulose synthase subunit BcsC-related outer membrane protein [Paraburkholderia sp. CNPSo 3272]MCP3727855.1 cellulose synthase subunit BcsC-related outer membrane protein [Paraburkholderia sp. CNPSo 3272]
MPHAALNALVSARRAAHLRSARREARRAAAHALRGEALTRVPQRLLPSIAPHFVPKLAPKFAPRLAPIVALLFAASPYLASAQAGPQPAANAATPAAQAAQLLSAARMWEGKNRPDIARGLVQKALLFDPQQPDALALLGEIELRSNRPAEAAKILAQLKKVAPNASATKELDDAYRVATSGKMEMAQIRLLAAAGKSEEASARLLKLFPNGAPAGDLAGDYYRILAGTTAGRAQAIGELRTRVKQNPNDPRLALILGDLLTDRADTRMEGLNLIYHVYQRQDSNRAFALELWRRALASAGHDDPAYYVWYLRYLQEVPDDSDAKQTVADLGKKLGAKGQAQAQALAQNPSAVISAPPATAAGNARASTQARARPPGPGAADRARGLAQLDRGDLKDAETSLQSAQRANPNDGETIGALGLVRLREGRHDEARELFARALKLDPDNAGKWRSLEKTAAIWGTIAKAREANSQGKPEEAETLAREALKLDPGNTTASDILGNALIAQKKWPEAEAVLRPLVNAPKPDMDALRGLVTVLRETGRASEIEPLIAATTPRVSGSSAEQKQLRAELLSIQADQLLADNRKSPAIAKLEEAVRLTPDDAWTRFRLARQYRDLGLPALGRQVMEDGLKVSQAPDMRYATALYLNSVDDVDAAAAQLDAVPEAQRSEGMRQLMGNLAAQKKIAQARQLIAQGKEDEARALLDSAAADANAANDPQMLATVGREWIAIGEPDRGLKLVQDWLAAHPDDPAANGARVRYGELLAAANRDDAWANWIDATRDQPGITDEQKASLDDQELRLVARETDRQIEAGDLTGARHTLDAVPDRLKTTKRWLLEDVDLREAKGDYKGAMASAQKVLVTQPDDADARLAVARMLERVGRDREAADMVRAVLADTAENDIDTRLAVARRFTALGLNDEASAVVEPLREQYPDNPDITIQAGRVAQARGNYNEAASLYRTSRTQEVAEGTQPDADGTTSAGRALQSLEDRKQGQVATGWYQSNLSGDPGISELHATEVPVYVRIPDGYTGHYFFHADTVYLNAGTLPGNDLDIAYKYGKIAALGNAGLGSVNETATGVALAAGYEFSGANNSWRADIGSTPVGFPITSVLGGIQYRHDFPSGSSLALDVSRRPVTASLVSYAGGIDPVTGEKWGGVVRNGFTARGAQDFGPGTIFTSIGFGLLTGTNVETNQEFKVRSGYDWSVFKRPDQIVSSGLTLNYWKYSKNEHNYTFGNGGYYSPQSYFSVSIPLDWTGRYKKLSWEIDGSVGMSFTNENESPFYPTRPGLQAQALAFMSANDLGSPFFGGGSGGGFSYAVEAAAEYRVTEHFVVGGRFRLDRSRDYAPNVGVLYLRYFFSPQKGPVPFPPRPVVPYSAY